MEKLCKDCNTKLIIGENINQGRFSNWNYVCNPCNSKRQLKLIRAKEDGYQTVYLLPETNWVGTTKNVYQRMQWHKREGNLTNVKNYKVLYKTKSREEALELEELLHDIGYKGKHAHNSYK